VNLTPGQAARAAFLALLPAAAAAGAKALPVLLCLTAILSTAPSRLRQAIEKNLLFLALLGTFAMWATISSAWTPAENHLQAVKLAILVPLGAIFVSAAAGSGSSARLTRAGGLAAFGVLTILLAIEAAGDLPLGRAVNPNSTIDELSQNPARGIVVLIALVWGVAAHLFRTRARAWGVAALVAAAALSPQFGSLATAFAFGLGALAFALAFASPRIAILSPTLLLSFWMIAAPFLTPLLFSSQQFVDALPWSWAHRVEIWKYVSARIVEQPWVGRGLDAVRAVTDRIEVRDVDLRAVATHPHSASLHIWYDLGAIGALLAAAAIFVGGWRLSQVCRDDRFGAAAAAAALTAFGLIANVSYSAWQEWWIATMFVAAAFVGAVLSDRPA